MTGVEEMLRETLADPRRRLQPGPQLYQAVRRRARTRRRRRTALAAAGCTLALVAVAGGVAFGRPSGPAVSAGGTAAPTGTAGAGGPTGPEPSNAVPTGAAGTPLPAGVGEPIGLALTGGTVYVLGQNPAEILAVDRLTGALRQRVAGPAGSLDDIAVDAAHQLLWVRSSRQPGGGTTLTAYNVTDLHRATDLSLPVDSFTMLVAGGRLWVGADNGLYHVDGGFPVTAAVLVPGAHLRAYGLAADPTRHRVLVTPADSRPVLAVDTGTLALTTGPVLATGKNSVAVVAGEIWSAGYGNGVSVRRLDPVHLRPIGGSPVNADVGPGAQIWGGYSVVWVRNGGDEGLECITASDGRVLRHWDGMPGPVVSDSRDAYAISSQGAARLDLGGCRG